MRKKAYNKSKNENNKATFKSIEQYITKKSHLLKLPKVEVEERAPKTHSKTDVSSKLKDGPPRLNITKRKRISLDALKVEFRTINLEAKGPLYSVDMERDKTIVSWNNNHPFYVDVIERNSENPDILNPLCFLVYSLAVSELEYSKDSDTLEIMENIRYHVGLNLATLLK